MTRITRRIRIEVRRNGIAPLRRRFVRTRLHAGNRLLAKRFEFLFRISRLGKELSDELQSIAQVLAVRREAEGRAFHLEVREGILYLLARHRLRAARDHGGSEHRHGAPCELLIVADIEAHLHHDGFAAGLLRQERNLHALHVDDLRARVNVVLRRIESLNFRTLFRELVAADEFFRCRRRSDIGALRIIGRNEESDDAVVAHEVLCGSLVDGIGRHGLHLLAVGKEEPPVAERNVVGNVDAEFFRVRKRALEHRFLIGLLASEFLCGDAGFAEGLLNHLHELRLHGLNVAFLLHHGAEHHKPRLLGRNRPAEDLRSHAGLNERLVETPARRVGKNVRRHRRGFIVVGKRRRNAVADGNELRLALSADVELALAVRLRLNRPFLRQHAFGLRDGTEEFIDPAENRLHVELARHRKNSVVRLIVEVIEGLQIGDFDVFNVASRADRRAAVALPVEHHALHALHHDGKGLVFAHFVFVSHHRHFGVEILLRDEGVDHGVGLPAERPFHVVVRSREAHEIVRAVEPRGAVHAEAPAGEFRRRIGIVLRALEHQVLKKMRHAGFAVVFLPRAHQVGHVDRGRGLGGIRIEHHPQAVGEAVLRNAFNRDVWRREFVHFVLFLLGERAGAPCRRRCEKRGAQNIFENLHLRTLFR